jgi:hypothetical protein
VDTHRVYAFTDILAEVNNGKATIIINEPAHLVDITTFQKTPNNNLKKKVQQLKHLISAKTDGTIQLADKDTPLRLGGGFAQIEEPQNNLLLIKRGKDAPRMPDTIDISAGLFDEAWDDPFQMMMGETLEIVRVAGKTMFYPCIIEDKKVQREAETIAQALKNEGINIEEIKQLHSYFLPLQTPIQEVRYAGTTYRGIGIAFEYETTSLELVGLLKVPTNGIKFRYIFGETLIGKLLHNEVLSINTSTKRTEVWRKLKIERVSTLEDELKQTRGFTSKAALIVSILGLASTNQNNEQWEIIL